MLSGFQYVCPSKQRHCMQHSYSQIIISTYETVLLYHVAYMCMPTFIIYMLQSFMGNQQKLAEIFTKGIIVNIAPKMQIAIACKVSTQLFCIQYQSVAIFYFYLCAKFHEDWLRTHGVIHSLVKLVDSHLPQLGQSSKVLVSHPSQREINFTGEPYLEIIT